jgi:copper transport protein
MPSGSGARRLLTFPVLLLTLLGVVLVDGPPAAAHAVVVRSVPADGDRLESSPAEVVVEFSEPVTSDLGGLRVLAADGSAVTDGPSSQPSPTTLQVPLRPDLPDGTHVANYKIVSADGHPVSGALTFGVGTGTLADVSGLAAANDPTVERVGALGRLLAYAGALLAAPGPRRAHRFGRRPRWSRGHRGRPGRAGHGRGAGCLRRPVGAPSRAA